MKKFLLFLFGIAISSVTFSQIPLVTYEAVRVERSNNTNTNVQNYYNPYLDPYKINKQPQMHQSNGETIVGYVFNSNTNNFKRTKIKVKSVYGSLHITAIYNGRTEQWYDFNIQARKVGQIVGMDSELIRDNFEWKAENTVVGTIYFNY